MPIEVATYISDLNVSNPAATDQLADADNHLRLLKQVLKNTFPNLNGPVTVTAEAFRGLAPVGSIMAFALAPDKVPVGWALCDGTTVNLSDGSGTIQTPDLRNSYIVGVSPTKTLRQTLGAESQTITSTNAGGHSHNGTVATGGAHSHGGFTGNTTLTVAQIPSHQHMLQAARVSSSGATNGLYSPSFIAVTNDVFGTDFTGGGDPHRHSIANDTGHTHTYTTSTAGDHNHNTVIPMVPKSVALNFIMKI